jgi:hypothetical protein
VADVLDGVGTWNRCQIPARRFELRRSVDRVSYGFFNGVD